MRKLKGSCANTQPNISLVYMGDLQEPAELTSVIGSLATHIVLGEIRNVACYRLKPVQAVLSGWKLHDSAANAVHSYDLEGIFPGRIKP